MAQTVFEEAMDERNVIDDRRVGQCARFDQVLLECMCTLLNRGQSARRYLLARDHAFTAQEVNEMSERSSIPPARPQVSSAIA